MSFNRTIGALEILSDKQNLGLEDVLGLITVDLFGDSSNTCGVQNVVKMPVYNETDFGTSFISLVKFVRRFADAYKEILAREHFASEWEDENNRIAGRVGDIDKIEKDIKRLKTTLSELSAKEETYRKKLAEKKAIDEQIADKTQLLSELDHKNKEAEDIERVIKDLKDIKLPSIDSYVHNRKTDMRTLVEGYESFSNQINHILADNHEEIFKGLQELKQENDRLCIEAKDASDRCKELKKQSSEYDELIHQYGRQTDEITESIRILKDEERAAKDRSIELEEQRREEEHKKLELDNEVSRLSILFDSAKVERDKAKADRDNAERILNETKKEEASLKDITKNTEREINKLQEIIGEITQKNGDTIKLIEDLKKKIQEKEQQYAVKSKELSDSRSQYNLSKTKMALQERNYQEQLIILKRNNDHYSKIINSFLEDQQLINQLSGTDEAELRANNFDILKTKKQKLDELLKEELTAVSNLLREIEN